MMPRRTQGGFAYIAAVLILVVMASLAAAMVRLTDVQQTTSAQDVLVARASQAARAGIEWGLFRIGAAGVCPADTTLTDFVLASGFRVTVTCRRAAYNEGETVAGTAALKYLYQITATACNIGATCPADAEVTHEDYVERRRVVSVCLRAPVGTVAPTDCF